jgi:hypothetical protein
LQTSATDYIKWLNALSNNLYLLREVWLRDPHRYIGQLKQWRLHMQAYNKMQYSRYSNQVNWQFMAAPLSHRFPLPVSSTDILWDDDVTVYKYAGRYLRFCPHDVIPQQISVALWLSLTVRFGKQWQPLLLQHTFLCFQNGHEKKSAVVLQWQNLEGGIPYTFETGSRLEESRACEAPQAHQGSLQMWIPLPM